ncbi:alpha/beta hydrolase [Aurantivibrio plasticivorans]
MFTASSAKKLASSLKPLSFDIDSDKNNIRSPEVQAYLDHYKINFSKTLEGVLHGFGSFEVDGFTIAAHYWLPEMSRGTIFVCHGYYDHVGLFNHLVRFSLQNDYAVVACDFPGMGLSSGPRSSITSFDTYHAVLEAAIEKFRQVMPSPWYAVAQSMGSVAVVQHLLTTTNPVFEKSVLLAPLVRSRGWVRDRWVYAIGRFFLRSLPRVFTDNSHDEVFLQFLKKSDPLQDRRLVVRWVGAMKEWIAKVGKFTPVDAPVLIIQGDDDHTVDWQYNLSALQTVLPSAVIKMVPQGRHHLVGESAPYRAQVFAGIKSFIDKPYGVHVEGSEQ